MSHFDTILGAALAGAGGGSGAVMLQLTHSGDVYTLNASYNVIKSALDAGKPVFATISWTNEGTVGTSMLTLVNLEKETDGSCAATFYYGDTSQILYAGTPDANFSYEL